jgi:single-stranded DNA-binding protein
MTTADLNQLAISGHVRRDPELRYCDDGTSVCSFVLTHISEHEKSGHYELQFYNVRIHGSLAESVAASCSTDERIVVIGRLDCELHETLTGYQPVVSIIATNIITMHGPTEQTRLSAEQLPLAGG